MKKIVLILLLAFFISAYIFAQDIITKIDSVKIEAKIIEVGLKTVKYKKISNQDGPAYIISKSDILDILYKNGERDVFTDKEAVVSFWEITDNKNTADFILSFDIEYSWDSANGYVEFINPISNEIIFKTERCFADITTDLNLKSRIIYKIIDSDIVPLMIK